MMTEKMWMPLACKDLFLTGKPVDYMCSRKKINQTQLTNEKTNPPKLCEASRTLNTYLRIAEFYFSILDSKDND